MEDEVLNEFEKKQLYIQEVMYTDVSESVSYDEWSAREYGENKVDTFDTAGNLYDKGYRKEIDVLESILIELRNLNINGGHVEDMYDEFCYYVDKLQERIIKMKEENNMQVDTSIVKINSAAVRCKHKDLMINWTIATGWDHTSCYDYIAAAHGFYILATPERYDYEEGFVTTNGDFVSREEAMKIAKNCGQLKREYQDTTEIFLKSYMINYVAV